MSALFGAGVLVILSLDAYANTDQMSLQAELSLSDEPVAGAEVDVQLSFIPSVALRVGTEIALRQHWRHESRLQHDDPGAAGYLSVIGLGDAEPVWLEITGVQSDPGSSLPVPGYRTSRQDIPAGTEVLVNISDLTLPLVADHDFSIGVYIKQPGQSEFEISASPMAIQPAEFDRIRVTARSLVRPGEDIDVRVRMEDAFGNLVENRSLSLDLRVNGAFRQRVELDQSVDKVSGVSFDVPGVYRIELRSGGGGIRALSNPIHVGNHAAELLWVDFGPASLASSGYLDHDRLVGRGAGYYDLVIPADDESSPAIESGSKGERITIRTLASPDGVVRLSSSSGSLLDVVRPEQVSDLRRRTLETLSLVQVVAGSGHHLWLGKKVAGLGFPVGFVGSGNSLNYQGKFPTVHTAVLTESKDWFDAMRRGNTYVSIGERIIVLPMTRSLGMNEERIIGFEVVAGGAIDAVTLYKNGTPLDVRQGNRLEDGTYELAVSSDSFPFSEVLSQPRNAREWVGYIASREAAVTASDAEYWLLNAQPGKRRVDFMTKTHGTTNRLTLNVSEMTPDTVLEVGIAKGFEDAAWLPDDRLPQATPMKRFLLPLSEVDSGAERRLEIAGYSDRLTIQPEREPLTEANTYTYRYQDRSAPRKGDYYYLIVRQQDGAIAYSPLVFTGL